MGNFFSLFSFLFSGLQTKTGGVPSYTFPHWVSWDAPPPPQPPTAFFLLH